MIKRDEAMLLAMTGEWHRRSVKSSPVEHCEALLKAAQMGADAWTTARAVLKTEGTWMVSELGEDGIGDAAEDAYRHTDKLTDETRPIFRKLVYDIIFS
jgi:hypothetical protein